MRVTKKTVAVTASMIARPWKNRRRRMNRIMG
jgi:hypothetical protein